MNWFWTTYFLYYYINFIFKIYIVRVIESYIGVVCKYSWFRNSIYYAW
jgi:hypothetical protein